MVAGATGIDVVMLCIAADDSVMPQTREHVEILKLLGVNRGLVALTKIDAVDPAMLPLVIDDIQELLADSPLAEAPICPVSSITGAGLDDLKRTLLDIAGAIHGAAAGTPFRMAVDRVFSVQGRGTVVTGSVLRGRVASGDSLEVFPAIKTCRVRDLHTHGVAQSLVAKGQRAAINISGIDKEDVDRGSELATPGYLQPSRIVDVGLECLASFPRPLKSSATVRLEIGTTEVPVRVVLYGGAELTPGASGFAQLRCGESITTVHGQRFILRDPSALHTIGGGVVLRPVARRKRRDNAEDSIALKLMESNDALDRVEEVLRPAGFAALTDLQLCARAGVELETVAEVLTKLDESKRRVPIVGTERRVVPAVLDDLASRLTTWLSKFHRAHPEQPGRSADAVMGFLERITGQRALARPLFDLLKKRDVFKIIGAYACTPAFAPALSAADERIMQSMVGELKKGRFQPPDLAELATQAKIDRKRTERLIKLAVAFGELVVVSTDIVLHAEVEREMRGLFADLVAKNGPVTASQVREALGSSRKFVIPFLEYLDRVGFTLRQGDTRVVKPTGNGT
jgi:selenocysteine-specific elongation factor